MYWMSMLMRGARYKGTVYKASRTAAEYALILGPFRSADAMCIAMVQINDATNDYDNIHHLRIDQTYSFRI